MTSGSFRSVSRPRDRRKSQSARLRVLASQSEAALERSETFLRNQDPSLPSAEPPEADVNDTVVVVALPRFVSPLLGRASRPPSEMRACRLVHRKKALDPQFLQRDVVWRSERGDGREEAQFRATFSEVHG